MLGEPEPVADSGLVDHSGGSYPVVAGWDILDDLGERLADVGVKGASRLHHHRRQRDEPLRAAGAAGVAGGWDVRPTASSSRPESPARASSWPRPSTSWLAERKAERGHAIVSVGGGVPGDLGGFVAATYLRGMAFVQVPTSMAAMVDASIGGKVAINLPAAKNLVGAFYQPRGVFADASALSTLGKRELAEGWAEAIKHGFILDAELVDVFEEHAEALMDVDPEISAEVIRRSMAIKAEVVSQDERETLGIRILLNYGHTIGHALEASTEYGRFLHGEGVSVGMMGAARMAASRWACSPPPWLTASSGLLERFSLPITAPGVPAEDVLTAMSLDKKVQSGTNRWVMLEDVGRSVVRQDVPWTAGGAHGAGC